MARILVIDDSPVNLELMRALLEPSGYELRLVSRAVEALTDINDWMPDLIISDLHMPDFDGFALFRHFKAIPLLGEIPFVIMTSTAWGNGDRGRAEQLGVDRFIVRPIEPQIFLKEIQACLAQVATGPDAA